jgi:alpha-L-fucosidase
MTSQKNGDEYFVYLADATETVMPAEIRVASHRPPSGAAVTLVGSSARLQWKADGGGFVVSIPEAVRTNPPCQYAWTIKVASKQD